MNGMSQVKGVKPFVVAVPTEDLEALNKVVAAAAAAERAWLQEARERAGVDLVRGVALSEARREIRVERQRLRARGVLCGTKDLVMTRAVREELKARRMLRDWDEPPPGETNAPGRRWGVSAGPLALLGFGPDTEDQDDEERPPRLAVRLPADLGETLVRAAYWTSAPAVADLQRWDAHWGDGPEVQLRQEMRRHGGRVTELGALLAMMAPRPSAAALAERARLREQIVTTGDLMRAALARAIR